MNSITQNVNHFLIYLLYQWCDYSRFEKKKKEREREMDLFSNPYIKHKFPHSDENEKKSTIRPLETDPMATLISPFMNKYGSSHL